MVPKKGIIALMGSGEMTSTMVEVHKELLSRCGSAARAVFIDTPAGFQLNADQLSEKAVEYFRARVKYPLSVVSFRSAELISPYDAEKAFHSLRDAEYFLIGPGSPTYAVRQWQKTPIPDIITSRIESGGCLVAASAAALTVGRFTLPVYEIYKVGDPPHWIEGTDILGKFGMNLAVVPHWNNAEGGNHDTRFCYMGEPRFRALEVQLPADTGVIGLDEHTACLIDLHNESFSIRGLGRVTMRCAGTERYFERGQLYPLSLLRGHAMDESARLVCADAAVPDNSIEASDDVFWNKVNQLQAAYHEGFENSLPDKAVNALLELDGIIWKAQAELETQEFISQAREILRDMIVFLGAGFNSASQHIPQQLASLMEGMLALRNRLRQRNQWEDADAIRDCLLNAGIIIEDGRDGSQWHYKP
jgi:peptidase E